MSDLFDPAARARAQARADRLGRVDLLHDLACDAVEERLAMVNRRFTAPLIVGERAARWAGRLGVGATLAAPAPVLPTGPFDLAIHALALHAMDDPVGQLIQMRRALRPDGLLLAVFFGGESLAELRACLGQAEAEVEGGLSPRVHPMAELRDAGGLLQRAGLALPVADSDRLTLTYPDLPALMRDLRAMGETNVQRGRRGVLRRATLARAAALYADAFAQDGRLRATAEIVTLTGWAPAADQPQPLRPGSATHRLAEALGTQEQPAGDAVPRKDGV